MKHILVSALVAVSGFSTYGALAASPTYVGRWADSPDSCRVGEVITLTVHEMHMLENGLCRFHKTVGGSRHWHTTMTCSGEGSTDRVSADLVVKGDTLSIIYGKPYNTTAKFKRCGASGLATAEPGKLASAATAQQMPETPPQSADSCTQIEFIRGKSSATVRGMAESENFKCYTLETNAGQTATVKLMGRAQDDTAFNIDGVVDNRDLVTFKTDAKTYRIDVYRTFARERPIPFTMSVSVR